MSYVRGLHILALTIFSDTVYKQTLAATIGCLWMQNHHTRLRPSVSRKKKPTIFRLSVTKQLKNQCRYINSVSLLPK